MLYDAQAEYEDGSKHGAIIEADSMTEALEIWVVKRTEKLNGEPYVPAEHDPTHIACTHDGPCLRKNN